MHSANVCELEAIVCALLSNSDDDQCTDGRLFCNSATYAVKFWITFQVVMLCSLFFGFDTSDAHVGIYLDYH